MKILRFLFGILLVPARLLAQTPAPSPALGEVERVVVIGKASGDDYLTDVAPAAAKSDIPLRDLPQAVQVVPRALLEDRAILRVAETADTVSGLIATARNGGNDTPYFFIRGFGASFGTTLRDGFREFSGYLPGGYDPQGLERIEFLKGPSSVLYGNAGSPGGAVNLVSKAPLDAAAGELALTIGSFDLYRTTLDLGGPLVAAPSSKTGSSAPPVLFYRLNLAYENAGSYRDSIDHESVFASLALSWRITPRDILNLSGLYGHLYDDFDPGFTPFKEALSLPVSRNLGLPAYDRGNYDSATITAEYLHSFDDAGRWRWRTAFNTKQASANEHQEYGDFITGVFLQPDGRTLNQFAIQGPQHEHDYALQNELSGQFDTGPLKHRALVGVELARFQYGFRNSFAPVAPVDIFDPRPRLAPDPGSFTTIIAQTATSPNAGIYYQDLIELLPCLKLLHGGRFDFVRTRVKFSFPDIDMPDLTGSDFAYMPRVGLVYQPFAPTSLYFGWSNSFNPQFFTPVSGNRRIPPETGEQYEIGLRQAFFNDRLRANLALYQLTKENVLSPDPANPFLSIPSGEQRSRGVELDAVGSPLPGWQITAAYAYTDARVLADERPGVVGDRLVGAPVNSGSLWSRYEFGGGPWKGLGLGAGIFLFGPREATLPNTFDLPGYTRVDVEVSYRFRGDRARLQLNVKNLTDKKYFEASDQAYQINPAAPRTVLGTAAWGF